MSEIVESCDYMRVVDEIGELAWSDLGPEETPALIWAYYFFSVQFRENLLTACELFPNDAGLCKLVSEELNTDNLSPFPGIATFGERMNHDEFVRRIIDALPIAQDDRMRFIRFGEQYLSEVRSLDPMVRALAIASYESGGLGVVFAAMLRVASLNAGPYRAFRHFAQAHIDFDSEPESGHGALCQGLMIDDRVCPAWRAFKELLVNCLPRLEHRGQNI